MLVAQLCWTLCDPVDCSPPGFSVHELLQARILEWVAIPFSRGPFPPRDQTWVSCIEGRFFIIWAAREALNINLVNINWLCLSRLVLILKKKLKITQTEVCLWYNIYLNSQLYRYFLVFKLACELCVHWLFSTHDIPWEKTWATKTTFDLVIADQNFHTQLLVESLSRFRLFATSWTVACQAPLPIGFSRQEYWSGLPFPSPGDIPGSGIEPVSPALQADSLPWSHTC